MVEEEEIWLEPEFFDFSPLHSNSQSRDASPTLSEVSRIEKTYRSRAVGGTGDSLPSTSAVSSNPARDSHIQPNERMQVDAMIFSRRNKDKEGFVLVPSEFGGQEKRTGEELWPNEEPASVAGFFPNHRDFSWKSPVNESRARFSRNLEWESGASVSERFPEQLTLQLWEEHQLREARMQDQRFRALEAEVQQQSKVRPLPFTEKREQPASVSRESPRRDQLVEPPMANRGLEQKCWLDANGNRMVGTFLRGLSSVVRDSQLDVEPYRCFNCRVGTHRRSECPQPRLTREVCRNCGRLDVSIARCPRCSLAFRSSQAKKKEEKSLRSSDSTALFKPPPTSWQNEVNEWNVDDQASRSDLIVVPLQDTASQSENAEQDGTPKKKPRHRAGRKKRERIAAILTRQAQEVIAENNIVLERVRQEIREQQQKNSVRYRHDEQDQRRSPPSESNGEETGVATPVDVSDSAPADDASSSEQTTLVDLERLRALRLLRFDQQTQEPPKTLPGGPSS